jgi:hypothetical protein
MNRLKITNLTMPSLHNETNEKMRLAAILHSFPGADHDLLQFPTATSVDLDLIGDERTFRLAPRSGQA